MLKLAIEKQNNTLKEDRIKVLVRKRPLLKNEIGKQDIATIINEVNIRKRLLISLIRKPYKLMMAQLLSQQVSIKYSMKTQHNKKFSAYSNLKFYQFLKVLV